MSSSLSLCPDGDIRRRCLAAGACAVGFARAEAVNAATADHFRRWLARGSHASLDYMARNVDLRLDPRLLLPGAATVISLAFPYRPAGGYHHPLIADYALGNDYHRVIKSRLGGLCAHLLSHYGALSRVCVDSAPILERYWAVNAGIGFVGSNRQLIIPGIGSGVFLAEVITTLHLHPDLPCTLSCGDCRRCFDACPGKALSPDGLDARRCRSYLSIEAPEAVATPMPAGAQIVGCDICARVCPHNRHEPPEPLCDFAPDPRLLTLDRQALASISSGDYRRLFAHSALRRIPPRRLRLLSRTH